MRRRKTKKKNKAPRTDPFLHEMIILAPAFEGFLSPCAYRTYDLCYMRTSPHTTNRIESGISKTNRLSAIIIAAQIH
jgi:hypothetical protein